MTAATAAAATSDPPTATARTSRRREAGRPGCGPGAPASTATSAAAVTIRACSASAAAWTDSAKLPSARGLALRRASKLSEVFMVLLHRVVARSEASRLGCSPSSRARRSSKTARNRRLARCSRPRAVIATQPRTVAICAGESPSHSASSSTSRSAGLRRPRGSCTSVASGVAEGGCRATVAASSASRNTRRCPGCRPRTGPRSAAFAHARLLPCRQPPTGAGQNPGLHPVHVRQDRDRSTHRRIHLVVVVGSSGVSPSGWPSRTGSRSGWRHAWSGSPSPVAVARREHGRWSTRWWCWLSRSPSRC
jgi:hypothetical protein